MWLWLDTGVPEPDLGGKRLREGRGGTGPRRWRWTRPQHVSGGFYRGKSISEEPPSLAASSICLEIEVTET